mmetsp:Transcript_26697/g.60283  ORF Transcript_26697/g.60283 Transcript_26697/m.60283 type:complete len:835 (-) Transcript_26697:23-2527(-)
MSKSTIPASSGEGSHSNGSYPPRPSKSNRTPAKKSTKGEAKAGKHQRSASAASKAECVPHVVRVTFLGVAGLQANPVRESSSQTAAQASIATDAATANTGTDNDTHATSSTSASPSHPSLLIPLPSHLRVVATVSRTKTARGIPSGMSRVLAASQKSTGGSSSIPSIPSIVDTNSDIGCGSAGDGNTDKKILRSPSQVAESRIRSKLGASGSELSAADEVVNVGVEVVSPMLESRKEPAHDADDEPERFVALWSDNDSTAKSPNTALHYSNSIAFEADLRPSTSTSSAAKDAPGNATAGTAYAPKSFCVTVGLLPDTKPKTKSETGAAANADDGEPTFAIPIGFANLLVKGNETLDGKRAQVDLPLSTLSSSAIAQDTSRGNSKANSMVAAFPLIELASGAAADEKVDSNRGKKAKKQSLVKRMFSRRQPPSSSSLTDSVYNGRPRSIYQLGRPPNARERSLFLDRYSVDPSGDAVLRVGLEVFARGSELEKIFRRKNRLRKEKRRSSFSGGRGGQAVVSPQSIGGRSRSSGDSCDSSLFDSIDSDDDSIYSQSFFTTDSFTEGLTTWNDGSTMFTDGSMDLSLSYTDGTSRVTKEGVPDSSAGRFFTNLLNCSGPTNCNVNDTVMYCTTAKKEEKIESEFDPIEQVAIAKSPQDDSLFVNEAGQDPSSGNGPTISRHKGQSTTIDALKDNVVKNTTPEGSVAMCALPTTKAGNSSKKTHKKTNSSVTSDSADTALAGTVMASNKAQPSESIISRVVIHDPNTILESEATKPAVDPETTKLETSLTSVTLENEISPLATIKHVHRTEDPAAEGGTVEQSCEREVEYTLEQHKSR